MITKFINEIIESDNGYKIYGDGVNDWENDSDSTTIECLLNYIRDCTEQIQFANKLLKEYNESSL